MFYSPPETGAWILLARPETAPEQSEEFSPWASTNSSYGKQDRGVWLYLCQGNGSKKHESSCYLWISMGTEVLLGLTMFQQRIFWHEAGHGGYPLYLDTAEKIQASWIFTRFPPGWVPSSAPRWLCAFGLLDQEHLGSRSSLVTASLRLRLCWASEELRTEQDQLLCPTRHNSFLSRKGKRKEDECTENGGKKGYLMKKVAWESEGALEEGGNDEALLFPWNPLVLPVWACVHTDPTSSYSIFLALGALGLSGKVFTELETSRDF